LTAENELFARYDRELEISPAVWSGIAARITTDANSAAKSRFSFSEWFAGLFAMPSFRFAMPAVALALIAIVVGVAYFRTRPQAPPINEVAVNKPTPVAPSGSTAPPQVTVPANDVNDKESPKTELVATNRQRPGVKTHADERPEILFTDAAYSDMEDKDTATHLEQAQNLLISVRNIDVSDDDQEVDVSYEKAESRRLLNENIVLRRDAEMAGKFPAKSVLGSLEPFLIDIANLPDRAPAKDLLQIRDRVQKTEIVAELRGYE